jgi:hypothetical protein
MLENQCSNHCMAISMQMKVLKFLNQLISVARYAANSSTEQSVNSEVI